MTARRATAYVGGGALLAAWLAGAAGVSRPSRPVRIAARPAETVGLDTLALDVQSQALRLRQRLATAPAPQGPIRNPFVFAPRAVAPTRISASRRPAAAVEHIAAAPEPPLALLGIAENKTANGLTRTAVISAGGDDILMVVEGQEVASRYRVVAIGPDAVELKDLTTGATRRLVLQ
jgi:hypothetical protein